MRRARLLVLAALAVLGASCKFNHDPNSERFQCASDADCGTGWSCVVQKASGTGVCFPQGRCTPEQCDGKDDDCDGVVDDLPALGSACTTTEKGACAAGKVTCTAAGQGCAPLVTPTAEACDGQSDLDCDGLVGCADPDCEGRAGCGVAGCVCHDGGQAESDCADGVDNDGDGLTDCEDPDCAGQSCGPGCTCAGGVKSESDCGDGVDNDGDGLVDCADPDCLGAPCPGGNCGTAGSLDAGSDAGLAGLDGGGDAGASGADGGFVDLDAGAPALDGGADGGSADAGSDAGFLGYCTARETACANGLDDDGDGRTDCLDPDCLGLACADGGTCLADGGCQ